jgi:hypothetical protein
MEVAATETDGNPAALRITLKNTSEGPVDLPMPDIDCGRVDGVIAIQYEWHSDDPKAHSGYGWGCGGGTGDLPPTIIRAETEWLRLQPGEFLTFTESLRRRFGDMEPGTVDYWVEYTPPHLTPEERTELKQAGFRVPSASLRTEHRSFSIH